MDLFWFIFLTLAIIPFVQQKIIENARYKLMLRLEKKHKSKVIALVHRQEILSILGFAFYRYIDIQDSEEILRAIRLIPSNTPVDLILHTPGGLVLAAEQIAHSLMNHSGKVSVYVPHYAMSGGTLLALAADEVIMDENAVLGPLDPQVGQFPAVSILETVRKKKVKDLEDKTLIFADLAFKAIKQVRRLIYEIVKTKTHNINLAKKIAEELTCGKWTHDYPLTFERLKQLGVKVKNDLPSEIYELMTLYPQPAHRRPSVFFVPIPEKKENKKNNAK